MKPILILLTASLLITACTTPAPIVTPQTPVTKEPMHVCPPPTAVTTPLNDIMAYYQSIGHLPKNALDSEFQRVSTEFSQHPSDNNRIQKALLLSLPGTDFRNIPLSITLLNEHASNAELDAFTNLMSTLLVDNQQANDTVKDLNQALKNEKKHSSLLQNKIDAIKAMERHLILHDHP